MSKKYGLILSTNKSAPNPPKADFTRPSIFGSDSDSDEPALVKKGPTIGPGVNEKLQAKRLQEKAIKEDPTVFQYDELYDEIESKRDEEKKARSNETRKAKYIGRLLESADRRKLENERRLERIVQKEREEEGEQFADKEAFVTDAYRKKLEELRKAEDREKREDYLEAIGDVTKQKDLGGFYRHIYEQKLRTKDDDEQMTSGEKLPESKENVDSKLQIKPASKTRAYRKRRSSDEEATPPPVAKDSATASSSKKLHLQSNLDADSDFSIDSSSSDDEDKNPQKKNATVGDISEVVSVKQEATDEEKIECPTQLKTTDEDGTKGDLKPIEIKKESEIQADSNQKIEKIKKVKIDIWKKRTVGDVFEDALRRFYERKAARNG